VRTWDGHRGVTLVEFLIGLVIGTAVTLGAFGIALYLLGRTHAGQHSVELRRDADLAAYWIELTAREGSWVYLEGDGDDSLVVQNFLRGWTKRVYADGAALLVEDQGGTHEVIHTLSSLHFRPHLGLVDYDLEVGRDKDLFSLSSSKALRNVRYQGIWHFSEGSGSVAYDDSPFNNNAAIFGASWSAGPEGTALWFDGVDDYLFVPDTDDLDSGRRIAFSAQVQGGNFGPARTIINRNASDSGGGFFWLYIRGNKIRYAFNAGTPVTVASRTLSWQAGRWYDVYVQHDGLTGRVHFYRDGLKVGEAAHAGTLVPVSTGAAYIGSYQGTSSFWKGGLDEVKFASFGG